MGQDLEEVNIVNKRLILCIQKTHCQHADIDMEDSFGILVVYNIFNAQTPANVHITKLILNTHMVCSFRILLYNIGQVSSPLNACFVYSIPIVYSYGAFGRLLYKNV